MKTSTTRALCAATLLLAASAFSPSLVAQDATGAISLTDGRFIFGKPIVPAKDGVVVKNER